MITTAEPRINVAAVQAAGKAAGQAGRPNPVARGDVSDEALVRFAAWHLATVERDVGHKFIPGLPEEESGLLMFSPKKKEDRAL
jgi:hypothetical protein